MEIKKDLDLWLSWMDELADQDYVIIDKFFDGDTYEKVRAEFQAKLPHFSQARIGALAQKSLHTEIRGDQTYWLDRKRDTALQPFWEVVDESIYVLNRYCFLSLSGYEFHFANYPPGGHYDKHLDQFQGRNNRMISMIIYLNDDWQKGDGGELEIFVADGSSVIVEPIGGRCVMFKSAVVPHAVRKSFKDRYSLTGWLLYQPAELGKFLG
ncbi:2OG-Fe(II) oxygenase [Roseivirga sp. BDSF3-8]|uniref:2OG-Fe(II) oxygenase n=1 Tax=Roseivirga sp. BDSF3-8 TaxID=3241598 RepID=UPI0035322C06